MEERGQRSRTSGTWRWSSSPHAEAGEASDEGFGGGSGEEKDSGEGEAPPEDASEREGDV